MIKCNYEKTFKRLEKAYHDDITYHMKRIQRAGRLRRVTLEVLKVLNFPDTMDGDISITPDGGGIDITVWHWQREHIDQLLLYPLFQHYKAPWEYNDSGHSIKFVCEPKIKGKVIPIYVFNMGESNCEMIEVTEVRTIWHQQCKEGEQI